MTGAVAAPLKLAQDDRERAAAVMALETAHILEEEGLWLVRPRKTHDLEEEGSSRVAEAAALAREGEGLAREAGGEHVVRWDAGRVDLCDVAGGSLAAVVGGV